MAEIALEARNGRGHQRAYQLYEERLWENGHELEDWLRAEEEIAEQELRPKAA